MQTDCHDSQAIRVLLSKIDRAAAIDRDIERTLRNFKVAVKA